MPKQFHGKKKLKGKRRLTSDIRDVAKKTDLLKKKTARLVQESTLVHEAIDQVHHGIEGVHHNLEAAHEMIRERTKIPKRADKGRPRCMLVVGIGASAGGFESFARLLGALSPDTGMAFVFVQHLDPTHKSNLSSLLARNAHIQVTEIRHRTPLAPNHVYVIPPNAALTVSGGVLLLSPRKKQDQHLPVDQFFQSLAQDQGNLAVGVVLSGNGHDGTAGIKEIKAAGGITFAQDVASSKFPGMPESAVAAGCVDYVLPPESIARELERISNHAGLKRAAQPDVLPDLEKDFVKVLVLLRSVTGVDFSHYKPATLRRRMTRRMVLRRIDSIADYLKLLRENSAEVELLFQDVLINVTGFFRDPAAFKVLKKKIFPRLLKDKASGASIRIWVPGCATGEEVYSLAICLHEFLGKNRTKSIQIFGTDISDPMIGRARMGVFPRSIESEVSPERLRRYFQKVDGRYRISKFIRDMCIFAKQNVAEDPPFSKLDLISCRNLLIYLGPPLQKRVFPTFHYSLRPGGYLMLGTSETIGAFSNLFTVLDKKNKLYIRNDTYSQPGIDYSLAPRTGAAKDGAARTSVELNYFDLQKRAEEILLGHYSPPGIIVNQRMEVIHFLGKTGPYLDPATGTASLSLLKIVRSELTTDLRTALARAIKTRLAVRKEGVRVRLDGHLRDVAIEIVPFKDSMPEYFFLILFRESASEIVESKVSEKKSPSVRKVQADREEQRLRAELRQTKESLQSIIEEQEATNEELKSANEEIQSSNEELQSTNEELETAKEELQSTNEELTTLNEELQTRNADLSEVNNDLNNLISSFSMPILMLGNDLEIRRFTPLAQKFFNLIPSDIGRRISDINPNIVLPDLQGLVTDVIDSLSVKEIEVQDREGRWYSLRIRPYRTSDNKIEGAVIVLVDVDDVRQGLRAVMDMVDDPVLLLVDDLRVCDANNAFYQKFQVEKMDTEGNPIFSLGNGQWNIPALRSLLEQILPQNQHVENFKMDHDFPQIGPRSFSVNARRLYQQSKGTHYVLVLLQDITS